MARAGKRTEYITLLQLTQGAADETGEAAETWPELASVWAELVTGQAGGEREATGAVSDAQTCVFEFPNNAPANTVTNDDRVTWGALTLRVVRVDLPPGPARLMSIAAEVIKPGEA